MKNINDALSNRISDFKTSLIKRGISDTIRRHITTGEPYALTADQHHTLRESIGQRFHIHPNSIVVVGSCKLGFSIKMKKSGRYTPISRGSDIDIAVISESLFDEYWERVFEVVGTERNWAIAAHEGRRFSRDLFNGWVSPHELPNLPKFSKARDWAEFFDGFGRMRTFGFRRVSARLYRSWSRLEGYQAILATECRDVALNWRQSNDNIYDHGNRNESPHCGHN